MKKTLLNIWIVCMLALYLSYTYQTYLDVVFRLEIEEKASLFKLKQFELNKLENSTIASKLIYRVLI